MAGVERSPSCFGLRDQNLTSHFDVLDSWNKKWSKNKKIKPLFCLERWHYCIWPVIKQNTDDDTRKTTNKDGQRTRGMLSKKCLNVGILCLMGNCWDFCGRCGLGRGRRKSSLQHKMDSHSVPAEDADWTAAVGGFNSPACMFMSNVLSPTGWIDHRCHIWQWLTAPLIAMLALGRRANCHGGTVWTERAGIHLQVQLWILHHGTTWSSSASASACYIDWFMVMWWHHHHHLLPYCLLFSSLNNVQVYLSMEQIISHVKRN